MILREAAALTIAGIAFATPVIVALGRISRALLYGVESFDISAFASALLVLLVFAAIAGIMPARRAGRLDPMSSRSSTNRAPIHHTNGWNQKIEATIRASQSAYAVRKDLVNRQLRCGRLPLRSQIFP